MESISVIIPIYNRSELLRTTLKAIRHQSIRPCEIVLSDDGSEENILKEIEAELRLFTIPIIYVRQENKGFRAGTCRNNGIRQASGDILIFNDQDVVFTHNYYRAYLERLKPGRFVVSNPVRLTEEQFGKVTEDMIVDGRFDGIVRTEQLTRLKKEWRKDTFYSTCRRLFGLQYYRPKLRSGVFCIRREDIMGVNGFDENYRGWGNEDDDLGRRLYRSGMIGLKVHPEEYPVHLYHPYGHEPGVRVNKEYYHRRIKEIRKGDFIVEKGVKRPAGEEEPEVIRFNCSCES